MIPGTYGSVTLDPFILGDNKLGRAMAEQYIEAVRELMAQRIERQPISREAIEDITNDFMLALEYRLEKGDGEHEATAAALHLVYSRVLASLGEYLRASQIVLLLDGNPDITAH